MINAEKYLKDGIKMGKFISDFVSYCEFKKYNSDLSSLYLFLKEQSKFRLAEDERVILKNINKEYNYVGRHKADNLFIDSERLYVSKRVEACGWRSLPFEHLFQFIKNGEEYSIEELLKGE